MERNKESKIVSFCNSPLGALVIVGSIILLGGIAKYYFEERDNYDSRDKTHETSTYYLDK
ncbi:MAG: hypothetical protein AABX03_02640 [Nanoarchaeota archaeon]